MACSFIKGRFFFKTARVFFTGVFAVSFSCYAQPSQAPLQSFINAGGSTGTITSGIPTHFSSIGQPMVLPRPIITNSGGGVMNANELMFAGDLSKPIFGNNRTPGSVLPGISLSIDADFSDPESGVTEAIVQYRSVNASGNSLTDGSLVKATGNKWTGSIPASAIGELGVEYRFQIKNGSSIVATSTPFNKVSVNHTTGIPIAINTTYSKSQKNYRIIAIPFVLNPNTVDAIFSEKLDGYDEDVWRMYRYESGNMNKLSATSAIAPGKGYWFLSSREPTSNITATGTTVPASFDEPFEITLNPGWNQIGNPYYFNILWSDVRNANQTIANDLSVTARTFDGSVKEVGIIKKFEGAYVSFTGASQTSIKIPVAKNPAAGGRVGSTEIRNSLDQAHWEVRFNLSNGIQQYTLGGVGMHPQANEGVDSHDDFNIPRFFEFLEVKHPKQLYDMTYTKDVVPTQSEYVWNFTTETSQPGDAITLEWDNSFFGKGDEQLWLMDVETGLVWDMRKTTQVSVNYASIRRWRVAFGSEQYVKEATLPEHNSLIATYPNPFGNELSIEVAIVEPSLTRLDILDVNGRNISALINQTLDKGRYIIKYDSRTSGVDGIVSGIYLVRFQSGIKVQHKRIIKN